MSLDELDDDRIRLLACSSGAGMPDELDVGVSGGSRLAEFFRGGCLQAVQRGLNLIRQRGEVDLPYLAGSHYVFDLDSKLRIKALVENPYDRRLEHRLNLLCSVTRIGCANVRECHPGQSWRRRIGLPITQSDGYWQT